MRWAKYEHLTLPEVFSDKVIPDTDFIDKPVIQWGAPVIKIF